MAKECANRSKCEHCGYTLKSTDCFTITIGHQESEPFKEGNGTVIHCICYQCGEEWVE